MAIITPCLVQSLKNLVAFAEKNPLYLNDILDMINGEIPLAGDTEGYFLVDPFGTKIVFTIELLPDYNLRHVSISMNNGKSIPPRWFVEEIITILGFESDLPDCIVEIEKRENDPEVGILNIAEKFIN